MKAIFSLLFGALLVFSAVPSLSLAQEASTGAGGSLSQEVQSQTKSYFFGPIIPDGRMGSDGKPTIDCTCDGDNGQPRSAPALGCVYQIIQNILNLTLTAGIFLVLFSIMWAGYEYMMQAFNPGLKKKAKEMLRTSLIGMAILLSSFLIVDFIMKTLYKGQVNDKSPEVVDAGVKLGPWNSILSQADSATQLCIKPITPPAPADNNQGVDINTPTVDNGTDTGTNTGGGTGTDDTTPDDNGGNDTDDTTTPTTPTSLLKDMYHTFTKNAEGGTTALSGPKKGTPLKDLFCKDCRELKGLIIKNSGFLSNAVATQVESISFAKVSWRVTEAFPPTANHRNSCHYEGTCVDIGFGTQSSALTSKYNAENISAFIKAAEAQGLTAIFETGNKNECTLLTNAGVPVKNIDYISGLTPHFSVYNYSVSGPGCS
jgi:hypothetical protein